MFRKRIISFLLVFAIVISLFGSLFTVSAASTPTYLYDTSTVEQWNTWVENNFIVDFPGVASNQFAFWRVIDRCFVVSGVGDLDSKGALQQRANNWNNHMNYSRECWPSLVAYLLLTWSDKGPWAEVAYDANFGVYRLRDRTTGIWLVDSGGRFPYYCETSTGDIEASTRQDQWLPFSTATSCKQVSVLTKDSLSDLCVTINQTDRSCSVRDSLINGKEFYVIIDTRSNIYANADGVPYVAHYEATVTEEKFDYIVNEGDTIVNEGDDITNNEYTTIIEGSTTNYEIIDNSQLIDMSNGTFTYIGGIEIDNSSNDTYNEIYKEEFYIDELIYDFSTQNYQVNTYDVTYNEDNDTYVSNDYFFLATYNITNVYVTNIGQTELYKPFELYYALPDGRSSADLTAEEVAGMSFEFADCVNYAKSATDTYLRALYHFDGNTNDSSYFSTQGKFEWEKGASIEYMDVGTFNGALYLGPEEHKFKITLPSNLGSGDFTLQFRYYQAGSADTQSNIENYVSIGGNIVLQWDEGSIYNGAGTKLSALTVGTWQELAIIRHNGVLYLYHNGLCLSGTVNLSVWNTQIVVGLGSTTRAYSMLDELRVIDFALAETGYSYTCTSVPYDTNTVLVLPDSAFPIADEYWEFKSSGNNILSQYNLDDWTGNKILNSYFSSWTPYSSCYASSGYSSPDGGIWNADVSTGTKIKSFPYFYYSSNLFSYESYVEGVKFNKVTAFSNLDYLYSLVRAKWDESSSAAGSMYWRNGSGGNIIPTYGLYSILASRVGKTQALPSGQYTFSLVNNSGEVSSVSFNLPNATTLNYSSSVGALACYEYTSTAFGYEFGMLKLRQLEYDSSGGSYAFFLVVTPVVDNPDPIMYMELVEGSSTDLTAEKISCIYSSEEVKPNTAAIQTDIPIKGYTVGGVRPTFPVRGDVWMPVSNNRISGVYIYNGSAWTDVNARWYTGSRWIPIYGFDITTLEDCWDIADIDTTVVIIGSESQFWSWLQRAWQQMLDKLDAIIIALGGDPNYSPDSSGGGTGLWDRIKQTFSDALASIIETLMTFITDVLQLVLNLVYDLLSFLFNFLTNEVITGIANLFSSFTDGSLIVFFQQVITGTDENGNEVSSTVIALPEGIATAFAFFAGVIMILPDELRTLLIFGVGALILVGILKLVKS